MEEKVVYVLDTEDLHKDLTCYYWESINEMPIRLNSDGTVNTSDNTLNEIESNILKLKYVVDCKVKYDSQDIKIKIVSTGYTYFSVLTLKK